MAFDAVTDGYLNSAALAACFDARATVAAMLAFEAALAAAAAELGLIPHAAATLIGRTCVVDAFDLAAIKHAPAASSSAAIPVVDQLTAAVAARDAEAALYVHWGSSTQDVMDSALMLQARAGLDLLSATLDDINALLAALVRAHRTTLMVARTLSQHALPTTFGYKAALWLDALVNARAELDRVRALLPLQFGGAAGTLASFATVGLALRDAVACRLALRAVVPWHTDRTVVRSIACALAITAAAAGKLGHDLILLQQNEIAEVAEAQAPGRGGSSALPHKHNPIASIAVVAGAHRMPGLLAALFACYDHSHERATGAWHAEWYSLRDMFVTVGSMIEQLARALTDIEVNAAAMAGNLARTRGLIMSEAVAMALAAHIGRGAAQSLVKNAVAEAGATQRDLGQVLTTNGEVVRLLGRDGLARALAPAHYLGAIDALIDTVLERQATAAAAP